MNTDRIIKTVFTSAFICLTICISFAQTQQGYVKTLGRPDKKGEALSGVTVRVKGQHNAILSKEDGTFSLLMTDKKNGEAYSLQQVQKNGYELNETDIIGRQFAFSDKVRLEIVMVSSAVLQAEKQRIEDNAYRTAEKNYQAKYDFIEKQRSNNEITIEQYRERLADLQDKFEKYQSLIDGLAEHYAHTDYDKLDEKDREINICIENGDLERADSLINTLFDPIGVLERNTAALASIEQQIGQAQGIIAQANEDMAAVLKQQEKDAEYLYQLYTIALARYDQEKAGRYIETRALLDTTNAGWQYDASLYFSRQNEFEKAETFYLRTLNIYNNNLRLDSVASIEIKKVYALNNLSVLYCTTQRFQKSEPLLMEAHNLCKHISIEDSEAFTAYALAHARLLTANNLCNLFISTNRFEEAANWIIESVSIYSEFNASREATPTLSEPINMQFMQTLYYIIELCDLSQALSVVSKAITENVHLSDFMETLTDIRGDLDDIPESYGSTISQLCLSISKLYMDPQHLSAREEMLRLALDIQRHLAQNNPKAFEPSLVNYISSYAEFLMQTNRMQESEALFKESLNITRRLANDNPQVYSSSMSNSLFCIGALYLNMYRFPESEQMFRESLQIVRELVQTDPKAYTLNYIQTLNALALVLTYSRQYDEAESLYLSSINLCRENAGNRADSLVVMTNLAGSLYNLARLYHDTNRIEESITTYEETIETTRLLIGINPQSEELKTNLIQYLCDLASLHTLVQNQEKAKQAFDEALEIAEQLSSEHPVDESIVAFVLNMYANYNRDTGNLQVCQEQYQRSLDLYRKLSERYPDIPHADIASCLIEYSVFYYNNQQFGECESLLEEALSICRQNYENDDSGNFTFFMAQSLLYLGIVKFDLQQYQQAIIYTEEAYEIASAHRNDDIRYFDTYVSSAESLCNAYTQTKEHRKAYQILMELIPPLKTMCQENPDELWQERYATTAGSLSYFAIFMKKFQESEQYSTEALTINPSLHWVFSNLAVAYLFQGKIAEAEEIYQVFKGELKDDFLQDLQDFEAANIIPKNRKADVERIRKMLLE